MRFPPVGRGDFQACDNICAELMATAGKYFRKVYKGNKAHIDFKIQPLEGRITGDWNQLRFLLENLIDEACSVTLDGAVCLSARKMGNLYVFCLQICAGKRPVKN